MIGCAGYFGASSRATSSGARAARAPSAVRSGEATRAARGNTPAIALIASSEVASRRRAGTGIDHAAPVPLSARALMNEPGAGGCAAAPAGLASGQDAGGRGIGGPAGRLARTHVDHHRRRLHRRPAPDVVRCRIELAVEEAAGRREGKRRVRGRDRRLAARVGPRAGQRRNLPLGTKRRGGTVGKPPVQHAHDDGGAGRVAVEPSDQDQLGPFRIAGPDRLDCPHPAARLREAGSVNQHGARAIGHQRAQGLWRFSTRGRLPFRTGRRPSRRGRNSSHSTQTQREQGQTLRTARSIIAAQCIAAFSLYLEY